MWTDPANTIHFHIPAVYTVKPHPKFPERFSLANDGYQYKLPEGKIAINCSTMFEKATVLAVVKDNTIMSQQSYGDLRGLSRQGMKRSGLPLSISA